jgi:hydrogenase maturation protease
MAHILVLAWGNPSRGDDALGPAFIDRVKRDLKGTIHTIDYVTDFQLQPEHATDLRGRDAVLFVDASATAPGPFTFSAVVPARDPSFTTHAMSPAALLAAYHGAFHADPPPSYTLAIRGEHFVLGEPMSAAAGRNLDAAVAFFIANIARNVPPQWPRWITRR